MAESGSERRLAAIVAIDVAGYSRLMGADEEGTLARLQGHRDAVTPLVQDHGGRLVGTAGDGLLLEFPSVVEAVSCAVKFQAMMAGRNAGIPDDSAMLFRVGINLGDVLATDDGDIYGDGVNVAARIEALAAPGGICISRIVRDGIRDRMDIALKDMGEVEVKNIARPVRVFRVLADGAVDAEIEAEVTGQPFSASARPAWQSAALAIGLMVALAIGGGVWWWLQRPDFEPADPKKFAYKLPQKPSIAVLPFDNLTGDKGNDFLSDGLSENIIAMLSAQSNLFVIARNSSFTFKGKAVKVQRVAEQLGVRYVLEGSIQRQGTQLRVTAQLVDALSGHHLWVGRYDHAMTDMSRYFEIQDQITGEIAKSLSVRLIYSAFYRRLPKQLWNVDTLRKFDRAAKAFEFWSKEGNQEAAKLYTEMLRKYPDTTIVLTMLAWCHWQKVSIRTSKNPRQDLAKARDYAERALAVDDKLAMAHTVLAMLDLFARKHASAIAHADKAHALDPNGFNAPSGLVRLHSGQPEKAVTQLRAYIRREPIHQDWVDSLLASALMQLGQNDEAQRINKALLASKTENATTRPRALRSLTIIAVRKNDMAKARFYMKRYLALDTKASVAGRRRALYFAKDGAALERDLAALRKAGLPEHPPGKGPKAKAKKPAIAVLPFANLSADKEQEYFADGMTDDLITDLSKLSGLIVIARNSVFTYKGKNVKVQEIARDLNVTHVLEGSVRRVDDKVRINAQLIDASSGAHLWSERFDRDFKDIFALQDEVLGKITAALKLNLTRGGKIQNWRRTDNLAAYDALLRGISEYHKRTPAAQVKAIQYFNTAVELEPDYKHGHAWLALTYTSTIRRYWFHLMALSNFKANRLRKFHIEKAGADDPLVVALRAFLLLGQYQYDPAVAAARKAVSLAPNADFVHHFLALTLLYAGEISLAEKAMDFTLRLNPEGSAGIFETAALLRFFQKRYDAAIAFADRTIASSALGASNAYRNKILAQVQSDRVSDAKQTFASFSKVQKKLGRYSRVIVTTHWRLFMKDPAMRTELSDADQKAWAFTSLMGGSALSKLPGSDVGALLLGKTINGYSGDADIVFSMQIGRSGKLALSGSAGKGAGQAKVRGNDFCWRKQLNSNWSCFEVWQNPKGSRKARNTHRFSGPAGVFYFSIVP